MGQVEEDDKSDRALNNGDGALCKDNVETNVGGNASSAVGSTSGEIKEVDKTLNNVGEADFGTNVGDCVGNIEVDWMASASGEVKEKEDVALGMDDGWGEDGLASSRLV